MNEQYDYEQCAQNFLEEQLWFSGAFNYDEDQKVVRYAGVSHSVSEGQLKVILRLWQEYKNEVYNQCDITLLVSEETLVKDCFPETANTELRAVFRNSPLWKTLVRFPYKGRYGLHFPEVRELVNYR